MKLLIVLLTRYLLIGVRAQELQWNLEYDTYWAHGCNFNTPVIGQRPSEGADCGGKCLLTP